MATLVALDQHRQAVHISEVTRGLSCACVCIACHEAVVAKKGPQREHHFSHPPGAIGCHGPSFESQLHLAAKRWIQEAGRLVVPPLDVAGNVLGIRALDEPTCLTFGRVELECNLGKITPDVLCHTRCHKALAVEIYCSSPCDHQKLAWIARVGLPTIEIDLHDMDANSFDLEAAKKKVIEDRSCKRWIWPDGKRGKFFPLEIVSAQDATFVIKEFRPSEIGIRMERWSEAGLEVLGGLAKVYGGHWDGTYWMFKMHASDIRDLLRRKSGLLVLMREERRALG